MRLLSYAEIKTIKGITYSRPQIYKMVRDRKFPSPLKLNEGAKAKIAWLDRDIDNWIENLVKVRDQRVAERKSIS